MQEVDIADLKDQLSHYVRLAESGEEVLVKDHDRPVARLVSANESLKMRSIKPKYTREQAEEMLAKLPKPDMSKITPEVIEDSLRWMREDRSDRWFKK